ncbi:hypothetical protein HMPREF0551_0675 [Lautropia mirabilis ATCC 51599]|uniref:Uncharacterized protein n=1 Tax=Lautropia mirabilis ATCC 51599 TaxID=887898 RepID=E7RVG3_9BURK|nr:hypothetical protein HMPREF0551_0675 [Lautropia mirabilis ATCC 51599]
MKGARIAPFPTPAEGPWLTAPHDDPMAWMPAGGGCGGLQGPDVD